MMEFYNLMVVMSLWVLVEVFYVLKAEFPKTTATG